jgi:hypothetical protein
VAAYGSKIRAGGRSSVAQIAWWTQQRGSGVQQVKISISIHPAKGKKMLRPIASDLTLREIGISSRDCRLCIQEISIPFSVVLIIARTYALAL